jgi:excisionase family DNA binding protein
MLTSEAADRLGIKARSVARLIKKGLIKAEKRGRDYWIKPEEVDRYLRERRPAHRPTKSKSEVKN